MKKLFVTMLLAASLGLSACGENSMSSASMKANLKNKGYTAEVMSKTEAEARIQGVEYVVNITDALYCEQGQEVILAFFCANIDDATAFVQKNVAVMYRFGQQYSEQAKTGSYNNVAYVGTPNMVSAAGIGNI